MMMSSFQEVATSDFEGSLMNSTKTFDKSNTAPKK